MQTDAPSAAALRDNQASKRQPKGDCGEYPGDLTGRLKVVGKVRRPSYRRLPWLRSVVAAPVLPG